MPAFAKDLSENMERSNELDKISLNEMDNKAPLFPENELIFQEDDTERPLTRYGYKIENLNFLVPEETVSEVIQNPNIFNLPNSPSWIEGLINVRGNIIPVMNISKFLKTFKGEKPINILVFNKSDNKSAIAIMISELPFSLEYNDSTTTIDNYPDELNEFISTGFSEGNIDWIEFNPQELFKKLAKK